MGASSWTGLGKFVTMDLGIGFAGDAIMSKAGKQQDVSRMVSAALFASDGDVLATLRQDEGSVNPYSSELVKGVNSQLGHKIVTHSRSLSDGAAFKPKIGLETVKLPEVPDYAEQLRQAGELHFAIQEHFPQNESAAEQNHAPLQAVQTQPVTVAEAAKATVPAVQSVSGWGGLIDTLGLNGFSDVGKNLGYVLAMLPDMLVGMFTGKSRNLKFGDNMMPLAAIFAGMFVRNPLLKMLLVGLGGANLLNKAGHEALENRDGIRLQAVRHYRKYDDEPLDLRVSQPVMKGNTLVVTIDHVPSVITINDEAVDAYYKGALPLNTLTNAVLRKYDEQQQAVRENYDRQVKADESLELSRGGIK
jgi:hypothetical protein